MTSLSAAGSQFGSAFAEARLLTRKTSWWLTTKHALNNSYCQKHKKVTLVSHNLHGEDEVSSQHTTSPSDSRTIFFFFYALADASHYRIHTIRMAKAATKSHDSRRRRRHDDPSCCYSDPRKFTAAAGSDYRAEDAETRKSHESNAATEDLRRTTEQSPTFEGRRSAPRHLHEVESRNRKRGCHTTRSYCSLRRRSRAGTSARQVPVRPAPVSAQSGATAFTLLFVCSLSQFAPPLQQPLLLFLL